MLQTRIKNRLIRRDIVALALLATLPGAPVAAGQTFDEAVAAYERRDYATAMRGFRVHAEQGYASAQYNLGFMYAAGEGVLKDSVLAHMWSNIAGANGNANARELRDRLEGDMTRAEISRATELARACMTSDYQDCEP